MSIRSNIDRKFSQLSRVDLEITRWSEKLGAWPEIGGLPYHEQLLAEGLTLALASSFQVYEPKKKTSRTEVNKPMGSREQFYFWFACVHCVCLVSCNSVGVNITKILDTLLDVTYDKRVRPNYGGEFDQLNL